MFRFFTPVRRVNPFFSAFDDEDLVSSGFCGFGARPLQTHTVVIRPALTATKRRRCDEACECDHDCADDCETHEQEDGSMSESDDEVRIIDHKRSSQQKPEAAAAPVTEQQPTQPEAKRALKKARTDSELVPSLTSPFDALSLNVEEDEQALVLRVSGIRPEQLQVTVDKGVLNIKAQTSSEKKHEEDGFTYTSTSSTSFSRSIALPRHVDESAISAKFEEGKGVAITLPKRAPATQKTIAIQSATPVAAPVATPVAAPVAQESKETKEPSPSVAAELQSKLPEPVVERVASYLEPQQQPTAAADATPQPSSAPAEPTATTTSTSPKAKLAGQEQDGWTMVDE